MTFIPKKDRIEYGGAMIGSEEREAIMRVLESQGGRRWTIGPESEAFEQELADTTRVKRAVVTNSGSSALLVAMTALKLPRGSNVVIPALNFPTAFNAILQCGLNPVVVDSDPKTLNLDLDQIDYLVKHKWVLSAVLAVDIAGNPVDLIRLREIVGPDTKIVLDNCDGYGTLLKGNFIDTYADVSCVSFHAAHIITTGEGGAVLTSDIEIADRARKIREWGRASGTDNIYKYPGFPDDYRERYVYEEIGYNVKPLELQCAMGRVQLGRLKSFRSRRGSNFQELCDVFKKHPMFETVSHIPDSVPCWFSFPLMCRGIERGRVMKTLEANNVECRTIFSGNILKHPAYQGVSCSAPFDYKVADDVMFNGMFVSVHPSITREMIEFIDEVLSTL